MTRELAIEKTDHLFYQMADEDCLGLDTEEYRNDPSASLKLLSSLACLCAFLASNISSLGRGCSLEMSTYSY
jgi:hypothetical protein